MLLRNRIILGIFSTLLTLSLILAASSSADAVVAVFNASDDQDSTSRESYTSNLNKDAKEAASFTPTPAIPPEKISAPTPSENGTITLLSFSVRFTKAILEIKDKSPPVIASVFLS